MLRKLTFALIFLMPLPHAFAEETLIRQQPFWIGPFDKHVVPSTGQQRWICYYGYGPMIAKDISELPRPVGYANGAQTANRDLDYFALAYALGAVGAVVPGRQLCNDMQNHPAYQQKIKPRLFKVYTVEDSNRIFAKKSEHDALVLKLNNDINNAVGKINNLPQELITNELVKSLKNDLISYIDKKIEEIANSPPQ